MENIRIIFFAGKGGVGKTSIAAATGVKVAEMGYRTVVLSLDIAHSLSDIFDLDKSLVGLNKGKPINVAKNLWIQELDIQEEIEKNWGDIYQYITLLLNATGIDDVLAEELAILPGMEEVSLLLYINRYALNKEFDVILLDCAPTGESLRFISIPTTLEWYIKKIYKMERALAKYAGPIVEKVYRVPIPGDDYFDAIAYLFERLQGVDKLLVNPKITSVRLIANPEKIVLKETQRAFMYFCLHRMTIDGIFMNRILPESIEDIYFKDWKASQKHYMEKAREYFSPIPIFPVTLFGQEILGYDRLRGLAEHLYGGRNPLDRFYKGRPYQLKKTDGKYQLILKLPFIDKDSVELNKVSDELIIRVGSFKKHVLLPRQVAAAKSEKAELRNQRLYITLEGGRHEQKKK